MKKKLLSALLVFATLFAIALPINVYANVQDDYERIYLFSDNQDFFAYESQIVNACGLSASIHNLTSSGDPFSEFANDISAVLDNSIVVVDIQKRFDVYIGEYGNTTQFVDPFVNLENAFSTLKTKNCKIMFIDGTDEDTYQNALSFLDYVDVHVNLDFMYMFVKGIVTKLEELLGSGISSEYAIILDDLLCSNIPYYDFAQKWLLPFFEDQYLSDYNLGPDGDPTHDYTTFWTFLSTVRGVNLYLQDDSESSHFHPYGQNLTVNIDDTMIEDKLGQLNKVYMLGISSALKIGKPWCTINNAIHESIDDKLFTMMFKNTVINVSLFNHNDYWNIGGNKFMFFESVAPASGIYTFNNMISDFVQDNDMQVYNLLSNRRCAVTYMPITISEDGWIPMSIVKDYYQIIY